MKKIFAALALAAALAVPVAGMAAKPLSSEKLLDDYDKYAVVYSSDEARIYVDTETLERDPVSAGSLPVIRGMLYVEVYKHPLTYPDYGNYKMVDAILQYDTAIGADQFPGKISYKIMNKLVAAYTPDGKPTAYTPKEDPADDAEDLYPALYRLSKTSY